jgi:hypothetical protein
MRQNLAQFGILVAVRMRGDDHLSGMQPAPGEVQKRTTQYRR